MQKLIELALNRPRAVTVGILSVLVLGVMCVARIPVDILPVFNSPAVQVLTYYSGMPAESIANGITNPMERMTGQSAGMKRQESRSILGASIVRNYFREDVDPNGALTQVNSLALSEIPNLPPGTLPPVVLPYDPTATVPACLVAVDSKEYGESTLYDVGRFEVRNFIMNSPGANAPVVFGGKIRPSWRRWIRSSSKAATFRCATCWTSSPNSTCFCPPATPNSAGSTMPSIPMRCTKFRSACRTSPCAPRSATPAFWATSPRCATRT